jgi:hypothetical protein
VVKEFLESHVTWIVRESPLPRNFIADLPERVRADIMGRSSAQARMRRLAELQPNIPIPRAALQFVSFNKDDFMRRIRNDKGAPLGEMRALSWKYRKDELRRLGIDCPRDHFVFVNRNALEGVIDAGENGSAVAPPAAHKVGDVLGGRGNIFLDLALP